MTDPKSPEAFRTISEVADWLGVQPHVLRFWESKFSQVRPVKRAGGRRYYRPGDMLLLGGIRKLLHEDGLTIKGAQKILREEGMSYVAGLSQPLDAENDVLAEEEALHAQATEDAYAQAPVEQPELDAGEEPTAEADQIDTEPHITEDVITQQFDKPVASEPDEGTEVDEPVSVDEIAEAQVVGSVAADAGAPDVDEPVAEFDTVIEEDVPTTPQIDYELPEEVEPEEQSSFEPAPGASNEDRRVLHRPWAMDAARPEEPSADEDEVEAQPEPVAEVPSFMRDPEPIETEPVYEEQVTEEQPSSEEPLEEEAPAPELPTFMRSRQAPEELPQEETSDNALPSFLSEAQTEPEPEVEEPHFDPEPEPEPETSNVETAPVAESAHREEEAQQQMLFDLDPDPEPVIEAEPEFSIGSEAQLDAEFDLLSTSLPQRDPPAEEPASEPEMVAPIEEDTAPDPQEAEPSQAQDELDTEINAHDTVAELEPVAVDETASAPKEPQAAISEASTEVNAPIEAQPDPEPEQPSEPPAPKPNIIDAPDPDESSLAAKPAALSGAYLSKTLTEKQRAEVTPLVARLAALRDRMAAARGH